jgi:hypothetical protein
MGEESSAPGTRVNDCLFASIQTKRGMRCDYGTINIVLINNDRDPDLRRGDHFDVHANICQG